MFGVVAEAEVAGFLGPVAVRAGAALDELAQALGGIGALAGHGVVGLHLGEALAGTRGEPGGVGELDAGESDIADSVAGDELLQDRGFHVGEIQLLARARDVVNLVRGRVEVELAGLVEQFVGIVHIGRNRTVAQVPVVHQVVAATAAVGALDALGRVVPAWLRHGDGGAGDRRDRAARLGPGTLAADLQRPVRRTAGVDELQVTGVAPAGHDIGARGVAGVGDGELDRELAGSSLGAHAVHVQLAGLQVHGSGRGPDVAGRVGQVPAGDPGSSAEHRIRSGFGGPVDGEAVGAGVGGGQLERRGQAVGAAGQVDLDVAAHVLVALPHLLLRGGDRAGQEPGAQRSDALRGGVELERRRGGVGGGQPAEAENGQNRS